MRSRSWARLAPLTGLVFAVIMVVGIVTEGTKSPEANASAAKVVAFYNAHSSSSETSAILFALAFLFLLFFSAALRGYMRRTPNAESLSALVLAGGVIMAIGAFLGGGVELGLAENHSHLSPAAAQALNFISNEVFFVALAGALVFGISSGLAIMRGAELPKWLGWVAIVLGIAAVTPAAIVAFFGFIVWSAVVSVLIYQRLDNDTKEPTAQTPEPIGVG